MGQKVNPNILRLGYNKNWNTQFFEKKKKELPLYIYKDLEIKAYISRFFEKNGLIIHKLNQQHCGSDLYIFVSFFVNESFFHESETKSPLSVYSNKLCCFTSKGKKKLVSFPKQNLMLNTLIQKKNVRTSEKKLFYNFKNCIKNNDFTIKNKSNSLFQTTTQNSLNGVLLELKNVLNLFTNNQFNIILTN